MSTVSKIVGSIILGGAAIGVADYFGRVGSAKHKAKEEEHKRYIMEHPDEYRMYLDVERCKKAEEDRDIYKSESDSWSKKYNQLASQVDQIKRDRDDALGELQRRMQKDLISVMNKRGGANDVENVKKILDGLYFDDDKIEALKIIYGKKEDD